MEEIKETLKKRKQTLSTVSEEQFEKNINQSLSKMQKIPNATNYEKFLSQ